MESESIRAAIQAVSSFLVADAPLGETLQQIAEIARPAIRGVDAIGVTLLDFDARPITAVFTDGMSPAVDQGQYDDGTGPCLDAFRKGVVIHVDDTRAVGDRWPEFSRRAVEEGVLSTLSVPLAAGGETFGVFNLYSRTQGAFTDDGVEGDTSLFVTQAAVVLANARAYWQMFDLASGLRAAMLSRATIEQAKGVIMATTGRSSDEAFDILREQSRGENRRLRDVAEEIVAHHDE